MNTHLRTAILPFALGLLASASAAQADLSTWSVEVYGNPVRPPVWDLAANLAYQSIDSDAASFAYGGDALGSQIVNVELTGFHFAGMSEDTMGLALGVDAGTASDANADYLLLKWAGASAIAADDVNCTVGGSPPVGLRLYRVSGVPTIDEFWVGNDQDVACSPAGQGLVELAAANTLGGTGWGQTQIYQFSIEVGPCSLRVLVDGVEEFLVAGDFASIASGKLGVFCISQRVVARNVSYTALPNPGSIETLGAGSMGTDRIPTIDFDGCPLVGLDFRFHIVNSSDAAASTGILAIGQNALDLPLAQFNATLLVNPILLTAINAPAGGVDLRVFSLNAPAPVGADFFAQAAWFDPAGFGGVAFTPSVRVLVGE
ncbi:MAG: hypothetical protein WD226_00695 [Planctomycetota bacterium]